MRKMWEVPPLGRYESYATRRKRDLVPAMYCQKDKTAESRKGGTMKLNPAPAIITALSSVLDRLNAWLGRSQAEQAREQDAEIQRMNRELQERATETNDGK